MVTAALPQKGVGSPTAVTQASVGHEPSVRCAASSRAIWEAGYRPGLRAEEQSVGSGFDTADQDTP